MDNSAKSATTVKDPVCGMNVEPSTAKHKLDHAGKTYYFCCASCLEKFRARPDDYLAAASGARRGIADDQHSAGAGGKECAAQNPQRASSATTGAYVCPMCPEVRSAKPAACPRCGMALEPEMPVAATRVEYTCPMHPEIVRPGPGSCPICGMALEPRTVTAQEEENPELRDMTRRFWVSLALTAPLLVIAMADMLPGMPVQQLLPGGWLPWIELLLATPVVLWGGWPFFQRGWTSIVNRSTNMFTLIAMGTGVAYLYSLVATVFPQIFPASFREMGGTPAGVFRSGGGDHDAGAAGAGAGTARPQPHRRGHSRLARSDAEDGASPARWPGGRHSARAGEAGRPVAGASGREDSGGWRGARRQRAPWMNR